jgi:hypothetical protein
MSSKYIKKYSIPPGFQSLLSEFTKEILRNQPKDIVDFAVEYFKCLQQGLILDYPHRGQNIPCDFKPAVPKIPPSLKNQTNYDVYSKEEIKPQERKEEKEIIKSEENVEEIKKEEKKLEIKIEQPNEEQSNTKEKVSSVVQTVQTVSLENKSKLNIFPNCIDFGEKAEILNQLKSNPDYQAEIEEYITNKFEPNKNINDLIALIQKTIMSYYNTKGTENESEYDKLKTEAENKIKEIKDSCPLINLDFDSMEHKDAVDEFKKYEYYQKILKIYIYKLNHLNEENNELLDEINFFMFASSLKHITTVEHAEKLLEEKPYIEKYFNYNFQILLPEVYSFVLGIKQYSEAETINLFSSFSFRKRELCHKFFIFHNMKKMGRPEKKKSELLEKYLFISSPMQILEKMNSANDDNKLEIFESITEKLQDNYPSIWQFIARVVNIPIELVNSSFDIFMRFNTVNRDIILNYLKLGDEYKDIYDILSSVKIDPIESNFFNHMEQIFFDLKYIPELNFRNFCIYRNKLFTIPDAIKDFLLKFENDDWANEQENLLKQYESFNSLNLKSIYTYLLIKNMDKKNLDEFLKKIKLRKEKDESETQVSISEGLKESFTLDSDEFIFFKNEYEKWKSNLEAHILDYFKKENDEQKKEYFMSLPDSPDKVLIFNCIKIENNLTEDGDFENILNDYKQIVPGKNN